MRNLPLFTSLGVMRSGHCTEKLKKAVVVLEEKIQERSQIFQVQPPQPERSQTLAGIAYHAAGQSGKNFPAASRFAGNPSSKTFWTGTAFSKCSELPTTGVVTCG